MVADESLKKVIWVGSSRRELRSFPEPVQDHVGYALYVAQRGGKRREDAPWLWRRRRRGSRQRLPRRHIPRRLYRAIRRKFVRARRFSEEVEDRTGNATARNGFDSATVA